MSYNLAVTIKHGMYTAHVHVKYDTQSVVRTDRVSVKDLSKYTITFCVAFFVYVLS